jgi:hypothetical protein
MLEDAGRQSGALTISWQVEAMFKLNRQKPKLHLENDPVCARWGKMELGSKELELETTSGILMGRILCRESS